MSQPAIKTNSGRSGCPCSAGQICPTKLLNLLGEHSTISHGRTQGGKSRGQPSSTPRRGPAQEPANNRPRDSEMTSPRGAGQPQDREPQTRRAGGRQAVSRTPQDTTSRPHARAAAPQPRVLERPEPACGTRGQIPTTTTTQRAQSENSDISDIKKTLRAAKLNLTVI